MAYGKAGDWYINNVEGGGGEFKIANITWVNMPETFDESAPPRNCVLLTKTEDGYDEYNDVYRFGEELLLWDDEWYCSPKAIVTTKQPQNIGDLATWLLPYQNYNFSVLSGDAFVWNRGVILYGDCTITIS